MRHTRTYTAGAATRRPRALDRIARKWGTVATLAIALWGAPTSAGAQSAIIYGSLGNFDISNDTGKVCHGFEVDADGLTPAQAPYSFAANRYGVPQVIPTATGGATE